MAEKCTKCLRGTKVRTTGVNPKDITLKLNIGGAVIYITPQANGNIDITVNAESLLNGNYAACIWNGEKWLT